MGFRLAELFVEFKVQGLAQFAGALDDVRRRNQALADVQSKFGAAGVEALKKVQQQAEATRKKFDDATRTLTIFGAAGTAAILGFTRAGLAGTAQGNYLALTMERLSREVAGIFLPTVEKLIGYLEETVDWFRSLSGEQQDSIQKWVLIGAGVLAVVVILPKLLGGIGAVITVAKGLYLAIVGIPAAIAWITAAIPPLIGAVSSLSASLFAFAANPVVLAIAGIAALVLALLPLIEKLKEGTAAWNDFSKAAGSLGGANSDLAGGAVRRQGPISDLELGGKKKDRGKDHRSAQLVGGGFEALEQTYRRIQESVSKVDYGKQMVDEQGRSNGFLSQIFDEMRKRQQGLT